jgi:hypothetical protein
MKTPKLDLSGKVFGRLTVISRATDVRKWIAVCDCTPKPAASSMAADLRVERYSIAVASVQATVIQVGTAGLQLISVGKT